MDAVAGYEIQTKLYENSLSLIYRGQRCDDQAPVILKMPKADHAIPSVTDRYLLESRILNRLKLEGVPPLYELKQCQNRYILVMGDSGGQPFKHWLHHRRFTGIEVLQLAIDLSKTLSQIHAANVIHKDINPANILWNPETSRIQLIDFGNATILTREHPTLHPPHLIEGTLAYLSPEQTGRMNHTLDYRTDFYSLGATLYEMLTGSPPFVATNPIEMIYCHLAKQPQPPHEINSEIPEILSQIILKLLAKDANDRYQSAYGIKADLEHCLVQLQERGTILPFPLSQQDCSGRFQLPQKLYGRAQEIATLLASFDRIAAVRSADSIDPRRELVLIKGYAGIGKTALVKEIYKPLTRQQGYFISGKFDQLQRNIPYSAIVNAFKELMRQLLTETEERLAEWKRKCLSAIGTNGQIIINVIPELERIIGQQADVSELGLAESKNRFNLLFRNFVRLFCSPEHPLVIFLDDLQWADSASLRWMQVILTDMEIQNLLLIGAYRDNEVGLNHPLMLALQELRSENVSIQSIELHPLPTEHVSQILKDVLQADLERTIPLAHLVMQKTQGNPFFVHEFLKSLYLENLLTFDSESLAWQWDIGKIETCGITDNVIELMLTRLEKLPIATQQLLSLAACIGQEFDLETLSIVSQQAPTMLMQSLDVALGADLIIASSKFNPQTLGKEYRFLHDRVQQAAYSLTDIEAKKAIHFKIGQCLQKKLAQDRSGKILFDVVDHLNLAQELLSSLRECLELARLNLEAAKKAKASTAYASAYKYLKAGLACLSQDSWETQYDLTLQLHQQQAEVEYLLGNFTASKAKIDAILDHAKSPIDQAEAYNLLIIQYTLRTQYKEAIEAGGKALSLLGVNFPNHNFQEVFQHEKTKLSAKLAYRSIASLLELAEIAVPEEKLVVKLLSNLGSAAYRYQQQIWQVVVVLSLNFFLEHGNIPESCYGYSNYGTLLGSVLGNYHAGYESCLVSLRLSEQYNNLTQKTRACFILSNFVHSWVRPVQQANEIHRECVRAGLESGEFQYVGYTLSYNVTNLFFQGKSLIALQEDLLEAFTFCRGTKNQWSIDVILGYQLILLNLIDDESHSVMQMPLPIDEASYPDWCIQHHSFSGLCRFYILKSAVASLFNQPREALKFAKLASEYLPYILGVISLAEHNFYYSLALVASFPQVSSEEQLELRSQLSEQQQQMRDWVDHCPENFSALFLLIEAEIARISGQDWDAVQLYDQAIEAAHRQSLVHYEAMANERAARFWLERKKPDFAQGYLKQAQYCYQRWGADRKATQLAVDFPQFLQDRDNLTNDSATDRQSIQHQTLDLGALTQASQAILSEIVTEKLLTQLMSILMKNAGAQAGYLLLMQQGKLCLQVESRNIHDIPTQIQACPLSKCQNLPMALIHYVQRTCEPVVLQDATQEGLFTADPYIIQAQVRSALCLPILNQAQLTGILYLENNLIANAFTPARVTILKILSAQAAIALENASLYQTLEQKVIERTAELANANQQITLLNERLNIENIRMSSELAITRQIQQMIVPKEQELAKIEQLEIASFVSSADELGGDYHDIWQEQDSIKIGIGDVTGHGLKSGMLMLMVQVAVRTLFALGEIDTATFFRTLNRVIYENVQRMSSQRTSTLILLDYAAGRLRLSGQHETILVVRMNGHIESIDTIDLGFPIGLIEDISDFISERELLLNPGDGIVLYTDGIIEAANLSGDLYGLERLADVIKTYWPQSAENIKQQVIADVRSYIGGQKVFDDMTLLIVKRKA